MFFMALTVVGSVSSCSSIVVGKDTWFVLPSVNRMWKLFWQLIGVRSGFSGIGSLAADGPDVGSGFTSGGMPVASPFSKRLPMRIIASIVGVLKFVDVTP